MGTFGVHVNMKTPRVRSPAGRTNTETSNVGFSCSREHENPAPVPLEVYVSRWCLSDVMDLGYSTRSVRLLRWSGERLQSGATQLPGRERSDR